MRRVFGRKDFSDWLWRFLPEIPRDGRADWLAPGIVTDPSDGKLVHLCGLNMSRAWMLEGIARALSDGDPRGAALQGAAAVHRQRGLEGVSAPNYEASHWLGTFAMYLVTGRGLPG